MTTTWFCDRCAAEFTTADGWPKCPLCPRCLIATRQTEVLDAWTRPLTHRELDQAWRAALFQHWNTELLA